MPLNALLYQLMPNLRAKPKGFAPRIPVKSEQLQNAHAMPVTIRKETIPFALKKHSCHAKKASRERKVPLNALLSQLMPNLRARKLAVHSTFQTQKLNTASQKTSHTTLSAALASRTLKMTRAPTVIKIHFLRLSQQQVRSRTLVGAPVVKLSAQSSLVALSHGT